MFLEGKKLEYYSEPSKRPCVPMLQLLQHTLDIKVPDLVRPAGDFFMAFGHILATGRIDPLVIIACFATTTNKPMRSLMPHITEDGEGYL